MPIIEGQATGRVVLTSDIAPMTEIGADAVCYVNPYDADDIRRGFCKLINDKSYREKLIAKGLENVVRFDVSAITASYLQLYQKLLKNRKR
jgi:glycosyltransferase involved in cell wall biosynthesis